MKTSSMRALVLFLAVLEGCTLSPERSPGESSAVDPTSLRAVLRPLVGRPCRVIQSGSLWVLEFSRRSVHSDKIDMVGADFIRCSNPVEGPPRNLHYIPLTAICSIILDGTESRQ